MGKGKGCGASAPAQPTDAPEGALDEQLAQLSQQNVQQHLQRIGLRPDIAAARAAQLVAAGYDTAEQIDRLSDEALAQAGFRPGDVEKVAVFRERQAGVDPPIMATAVAAAAETTARVGMAGSPAPPGDKAAQPGRPTIAPLRPGGDEPTEPWLHQKDGRIVGGKGNDMLSRILASVNLITIFGAARTGKSTLMSLLCGEQGLFRSSAGGESFTQGIMIANFFTSLEAFSSQDGGECVSPDSSGGEDGLVVGFVDAEGQGDKGMKYDLKLMSAPVLLSPIVIFNWKGGMQKHEILVRRKRRFVLVPSLSW
eukprot:COSAG06_NODE_83_length_25105_cov_69.740913_11_plen_310_part_00